MIIRLRKIKRAASIATESTTVGNRHKFYRRAREKREKAKTDKGIYSDCQGEQREQIGELVV
ncbi:hypothetical protein AGMMS49921_08380 [Endomicrobiia bacterium]|nr:hypothetical protein AGMMS49921_08380 [Endomicrobiia bacterium]